MQRLRFESGISSLRNVLEVPAILIYLGGIALLVYVLFHSSAQDHWPTQFWIEDPFLWVMLFATLAFPPIWVLIWFPFGIVVSIARSFLVAENDGLTDAEWKAVQLYRVVTETSAYFCRALVWFILLACAWLVDRLLMSEFVPGWVLTHPFLLLCALCTATALGYVVLRIALDLLIDTPVQMWLERLIQEKVGKETGERYYQFELRLNERNTFGIDRLLGLSASPRPGAAGRDGVGGGPRGMT
jgi:hypothetical protein